MLLKSTSANQPTQLFLFFLITTVLLLNGCDQPVPDGEQTASIQDHVEWLADEGLEGRLAGTSGESKAANYVADQFLQSGLIPEGDDGTFFQQFVLEGPIPQAMQMVNHISRNVVARVEGSGNTEQAIIVGAHYDSQGRGGMISMETDEDPGIHPGADDNASGTAGLLWLADHFSENTPEKDIIFIAFSGEEMGLLGSGFYVDQMEMSPDSVVAMINLDMIGRMENNRLTIFGTGTAERWESILDEIGTDSLEIARTPAGTGASDHASFHEARIPVLHYFTGTHDDYHRTTDTPEKINYDGIKKVVEHTVKVISRLDRLQALEMGFQESSDPRGSTFDFDGPTLGVLPDYSYSGSGFKIDGVREGDPAEEAGMLRGDVIVKMGEIEIADIYDYMESLGEFQRGDELSVTVLRNGEEVVLKIRF